MIERDEQREVRSILVDGGLRKTISPVCGGPWGARGTLTGAGCCLLHSNSSYTPDMCRAAQTQKRKE